MRDLQLMEPHRATNLTLYTSSSLATRAEWTVTRSSVIGFEITMQGAVGGAVRYEFARKGASGGAGEVESY